MDFFTEQDQARRSTKVLVLLFTIAVIILIALTNLLVAITLWIVDEQVAGNYLAYQQAMQTLSYQPGRGLGDFFSWRRLGLISLAVTGVISCAIVFKHWQLSGGGKRVAEQLGGSRIQPNTDDNDEQRLLNVVEEMAIAAGMPVPAVYLLKDELGINAFAAGSTPADAVIGITRGSLDQFNREQLQGVIAHEFSHILNGDMRLNIRLIAILHGIVFIGLIGEILLRSARRSSLSGFGSRRKSNGNIVILGGALFVIGWLGRFFGSWIKSAVSRQREFLADASAVQFTRNPDGIGSALKIIGGYAPSALLEASHASEMSHLFFGQAINSLSRQFATHPPLEQRISRIEPGWDGHFIVRQPKPPQVDATPPPAPDHRHTEAAEITGAILAAAGQAMPTANTHCHIPEALVQHIHDPFSATALVFALLLSDDEAIQQQQSHYITLTEIHGLALQSRQFYPELKRLDQSLRLPLIQRSLPALKCMSQEQYKVFCRTLLLLIRADKQYHLFEWCLYQLVRHYLDPEFGKVKPAAAKHKTAADVSAAFTTVLSMLCHYGDTDPDTLSQAFHRGANVAGLYTLQLLAKTDCNLPRFIDATHTLAECYPLLKPRLLKALSAAAQQDKTVSVIEREMITAIAAVMDSPVPLLD